MQLVSRMAEIRRHVKTIAGILHWRTRSKHIYMHVSDVIVMDAAQTLPTRKVPECYDSPGLCHEHGNAGEFPAVHQRAKVPTSFNL